MASISFGASAANYAFTDLGDFSVQGLNNLGQLAGSIVTADGSTHAALWRAGVVTDLGSSGVGTSSVAVDVNDRGEAIGSIGNSATYWNRRGAVTDFGANNQFVDINNRGQIVGTAGGNRATLWTRGTATRLTVIGEPIERSYAHGINDKGQVVGYADVNGGVGTHAMFWNGSGGVALDLSAESGPDSVYSQAFDINNRGEIGGFTQFAQTLIGGVLTESHMRASTWDREGNLTLLGRFEDTYVGIPQSYEEYFVSVLSINDKGQAVGAYGKQGATMFYRGIATNLNDFLDDNTLAEGWRIATATDINNKGWITGTAVNSLTGEIHSYLLALGRGADSVGAVPEPSTWLMALSGLLCLALVARRGSRA